MVIKRAALAAVLFACLPAAAEEIVGPARAIEGDSLVVGETFLRLCGVVSLDVGEARYRRESTALSALVAGKTVRCVPLGEGTPCDGIANGEIYKRRIAQCFVEDKDLAAEMIRSKSACAWKAESGEAYTALGCVSERRQ